MLSTALLLVLLLDLLDLLDAVELLICRAWLVACGQLAAKGAARQLVSVVGVDAERPCSWRDAAVALLHCSCYVDLEGQEGVARQEAAHL